MTATDVHDFQFGNHQLAYRKFGNGPAILLAFHGFGQSSQALKPLEKPLGNQFTIYAIDLFFHGNSHYGAGQLLTKTSWQALLKAFLQTQHIKRFSILGFSLGGRMVLGAVEAFTDRIDQLILIAPDGITRNFWYQLATGSNMGRWLFRSAMNHLSMLNGIGYTLTQLGLLNRTIMRFAELSLATPQQRDLVYTSWTQFRLIYPNLERISELLNQNAVRVQFFIGKFDRIIPGHYILPFSEKLHRYELTVLQTGHNHLIELAGEHLG